MKQDSVARFDVERALKRCKQLRDRGDSSLEYLNIVYVVQSILEFGLVSDDTNNSHVSNKSDTIEIDRRVAERWIKMADGVDYHNDRELVFEIKKALAGRKED